MEQESCFQSMLNHRLLLDNVVRHDYSVYFYLRLETSKLLLLMHPSVFFSSAGVASKLEKKSQENARKMSSLVGMAGKILAVDEHPRSLSLSLSSHRKCHDTDRRGFRSE